MNDSIIGIHQKVSFKLRGQELKELCKIIKGFDFAQTIKGEDALLGLAFLIDFEILYPQVLHLKKIIDEVENE